MNRHEGVSCDACLKGNFRGRRYKCLMCFDYDLCAQCYEQGATTTRHTTDHPMQCILTRSDFELYYGGEVITVDQPQSFTCPYCGKMGFTDTTLQEHVSSEHADSSFEVVCPICASMIGGDPNMLTDDLASHLAVEHRAGAGGSGGSGTSAARDLISFLDEPGSSTGPTGSGAGRHSVRRTPHGPRGVAGARARRSNMHFSSSGGLSSLSPSARETVDPIAELLSQLSGVRRSATGTTSHSSSNNPTQLQQLQMQLQLERQQAARQQLERLPRRQTASTNLASGSSSASGTSRDSTSAQNTGAVSVSVSGPGPAPPPGLVPTSARHQTEPQHTPSITFNNQFLLSTITDEPKTEQEIEDEERLTQERSEYMIEVLFSSLTMSPENLIKCMEHFENFRREKQDRIVSEQNIEVVLDELPVNNNLKSDNNDTATNENSNPDADASQTINRNESSSQNSNESVLTVPAALSNDTMKPQYYEQPSQGSSVSRSRVPRGRGRAAQEQRQQLQTNNPSNSVSTISTSSSGSKVNEINSSNASGPSTSNNPRSTTKVNGKPKTMHQSTKSAGTSR